MNTSSAIWLRSSDRSTPIVVALLATTVALGLASRVYASMLPDVIARYAGDVLWASMIFWLFALIRSRASTLPLALCAFAFSVLVECSQLYRAPWIDALRASRIGALVLGQGFLWSDIACYATGAGLAALVDVMVRRSRGTNRLR